MITYKIHLLRSGFTTIGPKDYFGQKDLPLEKSSIELLDKFKEGFVYPPAELVYSCPSKRALETAKLLYPTQPLVVFPQLADIDLGDFQGAPFKELEANPDFIGWIENSAVNSPPGGEDTESFTIRTVDAINQIFHQMMEDNITDVAAITHSGFIMAVLSAIGLPRLPIEEWRTENGTGYTLLITPQIWMRDNLVEVYTRIPLLKD